MVFSCGTTITRPGVHWIFTFFIAKLCVQNRMASGDNWIICGQKTWRRPFVMFQFLYCDSRKSIYNASRLDLAVIIFKCDEYNSHNVRVLLSCRDSEADKCKYKWKNQPQPYKILWKPSNPFTAIIFSSPYYFGIVVSIVLNDSWMIFLYYSII